MRIALLSDGYPPWDRGGAQKIAAQLATGYADRGHEVGVVTAVADRKEAGRATSNGVPVRRIWTPKPRSVLPYLTLYNPFVVRKLGPTLDRFDPDVVHVHNAHYLSNAALRIAAERAPVVETYHDAGTVSYGELTGYLADPPEGGDLASLLEGDRPIPPSEYRVSPWRQLRREGVRYNPIRNRANCRTRRRHVERGVAVSDALRTALRANGIPCHETIRNGVDAEAIAESGDSTDFRATYGLGDAPFVLFGGRTSYNKGGAHLARAFGEVVSDADSWNSSDLSAARLVVTGDDEYVSRMREIAGSVSDASAEANAADRIVTTGWLDREELCGALSAATLIATPSVHLDPFPTLNLEAFAAGTPVVTSRFGGADELVTHGEEGLVVNPFEVPALAEALRRLLENRTLAAGLGQQGQAKVRREFTVEAQVDAYLRVLGSVADGEEASRAEVEPPGSRR